jgi:hypothetical protein
MYRQEMRPLKSNDALVVPEIKDAYDGALRHGISPSRYPMRHGIPCSTAW